MLEIEALCDYVCIMQDGKVLSSKTLSDTLKNADFGYVLTIYGCSIEGDGVYKENGFCTKVFDQNAGAK